jgi:hypothetical protein
VSYRIQDVSLGTVQDALEVVPIGRALYGVTVVAIPAGSVAFVRWGLADDWVPVMGLGMAVEFSRCRPELGGLYVRVPTVQAGTLSLYCDHGDGAVTV